MSEVRGDFHNTVCYIGCLLLYIMCMLPHLRRIKVAIFNFCLTWNLKFKNFLLLYIVCLRSHVYKCFCTKFHLNFWHDSCFEKGLQMNTRSFNSTQFMTWTGRIWGGGDCGSAVVKVLCYESEGHWFDSSLYEWVFHWHKSFRSHYGPGVDSASNRNEYQEYFLGVKAAGA